MKRQVSFRELMEIVKMVKDHEITKDDAIEIIGDRTLVEYSLNFIDDLNQLTRLTLIANDYSRTMNQLEKVNIGLVKISNELNDLEHEMSEYDAIIDKLNAIDLSKLSNDDLVTIAKFSNLYAKMIAESASLSQKFGLKVNEKAQLLKNRDHLTQLLDDKTFAKQYLFEMILDTLEGEY